MRGSGGGQRIREVKSQAPRPVDAGHFLLKSLPRRTVRRVSEMKDFQQFPWHYVKEVLDTREPFLQSSIEFTKEEFGDQATPCPECGKKPTELTWVPVDTADETWGRGEGRTGFVTCCMECRKQIDFFVDHELTRLEAGLRADGKSSQELPWSESEPLE